jgi:hypothetical protein
MLRIINFHSLVALQARQKREGLELSEKTPLFQKTGSGGWQSFFFGGGKANNAFGSFI